MRLSTSATSDWICPRIRSLRTAIIVVARPSASLAATFGSLSVTATSTTLVLPLAETLIVAATSAMLRWTLAEAIAALTTRSLFATERAESTRVLALVASFGSQPPSATRADAR